MDVVFASREAIESRVSHDTYASRMPYRRRRRRRTHMDNEDIAATTMILPRRLEGSTALLTRCLAFVLLVV